MMNGNTLGLMRWRRAGGGGAPPGFVFLVDIDGAYLIDADGAYLMEPV